MYSLNNLISSPFVIFTVKITKVLFSQRKYQNWLWHHVSDYDVMLHVNALKLFRFETNMFKNQRKCNKQNFNALLKSMEFISIVRHDLYDIFTRPLHS
jgi:hypothetical protein